MKVLAIDSTAGVAAVALTDGDKILADYRINSGNTHSTTLLPMIESVLSSLSVKVSDIGLFALSAGPGSFTGVRIGAATVKGLAFPYNTPCVAVSALEAAAENFRNTSCILCPVINARQKRVYYALFRCGGGKCERICDDDVIDISLLAEKLGGYKDEKIIFTCDAQDMMLEAFKDGLTERSCEVMESISAVGVSFLASRIYSEASEEEREKMTAEALMPIYLRKPQAEREREEKLKKQNSNPSVQ